MLYSLGSQWLSPESRAASTNQIARSFIYIPVVTSKFILKLNIYKVYVECLSKIEVDKEMYKYLYFLQRLYSPTLQLLDLKSNS